MIEWSQTYGCWGQPCMAKTRECCGALSLRRTGDDLHVSLHKGFKIRLAGIVPVFIEFTGFNTCSSQTMSCSIQSYFTDQCQNRLLAKWRPWKNWDKKMAKLACSQARLLVEKIVWVFCGHNAVSSIYIYIYIYGVRSSGHPTGQKVKPNMADMEALSYVGFSPPAQFLLYM